MLNYHIEAAQCGKKMENDSFLSVTDLYHVLIKSWGGGGGGII